MAHLTPGDSEARFAELGGMRPARPSLDRLPKVLSAHWEAHRQEWETVLRAGEMNDTRECRGDRHCGGRRDDPYEEQ